MKEYLYYNLSLRRGKLLTVGLIFLMVLGVAAMEVNASPAIPVLYVSPVISMAEPGESFTIDINVDDVSGLYSWSFYLKWDPAMLEVEKDGVVEGPFLSEEGVHKTYFIRKVYPDKGYMGVWCTLKGEPATAAASGSGTLATITFKVKASGEGILDLYETELLNFEGHPIKHIVEDGYLNVVLPTLLVEPSKVVDPTLKPGETFTIDVSILDAVNLSGFEFKLMYDTSLLEGEDIAIAPFLKEPVTVLKEINKTLGFVWVKAESEAEPVSGSGALATITFRVKAVGECALDLYEAEVSDRLGRYRPPTVGGHFNNLPVAPKVHDIAVTEVTASPREVTVGETISISVGIKNEGAFSETFSVTIYYNGKTIETKADVTLKEGEKKTLTFTWDTTGVAEGTYTVKAEASAVAGEDDTADNTRTSGAITVKLPEKPPAPAFPTEIIVVAVVAIIIIVVAVYYLRRRS